MLWLLGLTIRALPAVEDCVADAAPSGSGAPALARAVVELVVQLTSYLAFPPDAESARASGKCAAPGL